MNVQSSHFHQLVTYVVANAMLPITFGPSAHALTAKKRLEFYANGYVKEMISRRIVSSFSICDPSFFTHLRDAAMACRAKIFDDLFAAYFPADLGKTERAKLVSMIICECGVEAAKDRPREDVLMLEELQKFLVTCLFVAGCGVFFQSSHPFTLQKPDRRHERRKHAAQWIPGNFALDALFC